MKLNKLHLSRSKQVILQHVSAEFPVPGVVVLLGANGAGKSTLLSVLAGVSQVDSGSIEMGRLNDVFLMPEPAAFYPQLTVTEQLEMVANLNQKNHVDQVVNSAIEHWKLNPVASKLTKHLSLGYRQRLSLAQLMVSEADLLLLDEPMNGMDPEVVAVFKSQINQWKVSKCIVMATHIMHEAQEMADWVVVMHQGRVIHSAPYRNQQDFHDIYQLAIQSDHESTALA